jgi:site-specific recombinase
MQVLIRCFWNFRLKFEVKTVKSCFDKIYFQFLLYDKHLTHKINPLIIAKSVLNWFIQKISNRIQESIIPKKINSLNLSKLIFELFYKEKSAKKVNQKLISRPLLLNNQINLGLFWRISKEDYFVSFIFYIFESD